MNDDQFLARERAVQRWESLLATVESAIPLDFVPPEGEEEAAAAHRRPAELEIVITQRFSAPGEPLDDSDPQLVNHVTVRIRPESPRSQKGRLRQWIELCKLRDSIRHQLYCLRRGKEDWLSRGLRKSLLDRPGSQRMVPGGAMGGKVGVGAARPPGRYQNLGCHTPSDPTDLRHGT